MARFQLIVRPDGRALLTTTERMSAEVQKHLREVLDGWEAGQWPIAVVAECDVVQVADIEIDLPVAVDA